MIPFFLHFVLSFRLLSLYFILFCPQAPDCPGERLELLGSGGLQEDDAGIPDRIWEYPGTSKVRVQSRDEAPEDPYV